MLNVKKRRRVWRIKKTIKKAKSTCWEKVKIYDLMARMYSTIFKMLKK